MRKLLKWGAAAGVAGVLLTESPTKPILPEVGAEAVSGSASSGQVAYWVGGSQLGGFGSWNPTNSSLALGDSSNTAGGNTATVGGGKYNTASGNTATVGGGYGNTAGGNTATVGGGQNNTAGGYYATVGGGYYNTASAIRATVGGGINNMVSGNTATVGGGQNNTASGPGAFVGGGGYDGTNHSGNSAAGNASTVAGGLMNQALANWTTVGGGQSNTAGVSPGTGDNDTVGGGRNNSATGGQSTVAGGSNNTANVAYASVAGGFHNTASNEAATVGGGAWNFVGGWGAAVGGGYGNQASASGATVPGGWENVAGGANSFAAGSYASVSGAHHGAMLLSDDTYVASGIVFGSAGADEFAVRCTGGTRFVTAVDVSGNPTQTTALDSAGRLTIVGSSPQMQALPPTGYDARMSMKRPSNAQTAAFEFDTGGQPYQWLFGNFYNQNSFTVDYWDGTSDHFWFNVQQNGNVGIGTLTPAYTLDVAGQVHATGFPTSSDVRFKEDIHPIPDALEKVLRLNGVYFKWNRLHRETLKRSNGLTSRQVGLIAQQVREVVPELVSEWADEGAEDYLAVDYSRLSALTIEAIKELAEQNQNLAEENKALREELAEQDRKLKAKEESIQERLTTENKAIREEIRTLQQAVKRLAAS